MRVNGGFPFISVTDGDYLKNGELYLTHYYEGIELDVKYLERVLPFILQLSRYLDNPDMERYSGSELKFKRNGQRK